MNPRCQDVLDRAAAFVDNETDARWNAVIAAHVEACPQCARELDQQRQMKALVRQHTQRMAAPALLRARIRHALAQEPARFGSWEQLRQIFLWRPLPAIAIAAVLMFVPSVLTYYFSRPAPAVTRLEFAAAEASLEGEVICIDCFLLDELHLQHGHDASHRFGLRTADGKILTIAAFDKGGELLQRAANIHKHRVRVHGRLLPEQRYLQVNDFSIL
ncbi:zf-HC2 domain-containing protein [candidate division KSB1 bacterium]|nr:zf-HC2 domain-containing protein [candidate division KSB1 bacterium]